jgi:hypothetical protein
MAAAEVGRDLGGAGRLMLVAALASTGGLGAGLLGLAWRSASCSSPAIRPPSRSSSGASGSPPSFNHLPGLWGLASAVAISRVTRKRIVGVRDSNLPVIDAGAGEPRPTCTTAVLEFRAAVA